MYLFPFLNQRFEAQAISDEITDGDKLHSPFVGASAQFRQTRHGTVVAHYLHKGRGRLQPGKTSEVDSSLGMAASAQHTSILGIERIDMTRAAECLRLRRWIGQGADGGAAVMDGNSGGASFEFVDGDGEGCAEDRGVVIGLRCETQLFASRDGQRSAKHTTGILEHEIDLLGCDFLCGDDDVTLILAVFVIDHYYHLAFPEIVEGVFDRVKFDFVSVHRGCCWIW